MYNTAKTNPFPALLNNVLNIGFDKFFKDDFGAHGSFGSVPVNITETDSAYHIDVAAPGREKADFKVSVDQNLLTISYEKPAQSVAEGQKQIRREYSLPGFKRTFTISEKVDATQTGAQYINGILTVVLPKKEVVKVTPVEVTIA
jgi:HSP20 family protein